MKKLNGNSVIEELKGIAVLGTNGQEIDLTGTTYLELAVMFEELSKEELKPITEAIINKVGKQGLNSILEAMDEVIEVGVEKTYYEESEETMTKETPLAPVKMVNMDDFYSLNPDLVVKGIDSVSEICGRYIALLNSGMTSEQAYEVAVYNLVKEHENNLMNKQIELKKLEFENQVKLGSVKQLLN